MRNSFHSNVYVEYFHGQSIQIHCKDIDSLILLYYEYGNPLFPSLILFVKGPGENRQICMGQSFLTGFDMVKAIPGVVEISITSPYP